MDKKYSYFLNNETWFYLKVYVKSQNNMYFMGRFNVTARSAITWYYDIQGYYKRNRHFQRYVVSKPFSVVDTQFT
jgi:hypothetical protein